MTSTPMSNIPEILARLRRSVAEGRARPIEWRRRQLDGLEALLVEHQDDFARALAEDLGKSPAESWLTEIGFLLTEIRYVRKRLARWLTPERVRTPLATLPGRSWVQREPLGLVLILGAWNYPVQLTLGPLVAAVAAGNCAVLKPSELAPASAAEMAQRVGEYLDRDGVALIEGGVDRATELLAEPFDAIFYTGGTAVGRIVMQAAARHLTPVTLELGGKCPCLVDRNVNLPVAARRIVWGKFLNAGQTCVAPDYVLVDRRRHDELLAAMVDAVGRFYGREPRASADFGRIVNRRHFQRLERLLEHDGSPTGRVILGGDRDADSRYFPPTILADVSPDAPVMQEEVFGPILPVLAVEDMDEAIRFVNSRPKPLALYLFSNDARLRDRVLGETSSGGVGINDVAMHTTVPGLPFGGVGPSGMGAYHGRHGFETFSHRKAILQRGTRGDFNLRYPPYTPAKMRWLRRLLGRA
ncbi:MAG: aldehyde dehydrogenase family protein [Planctomycetia bacterium]|nr:aldehyde dehydrogenase family protein [Planctomycetia bacterium]